jgi:hypothetical protein
MKNGVRRTIRIATLGVTCILVAVLGIVTPAAAAVTITLNPATIAGSDFTWSCVVDAGGGTTYVAGASWLTVGGADFVETPRIKVTGATAQTLSYTRDGNPNQAYQYRCKSYPTATGGSSTNSAKLDVTTFGDTRFGDIVGTAHDPFVTKDLAGFVGLYDAHRAALGGVPLGVRVYAGITDPIPIPTESSPTGTDQIMAWVAANHSDESITVSFKNYDATRLGSLLTWAQSHAIDLTVIYFHEVQDDWGKNHEPRAEPTFYKNVYQQMRTVIDAHPWHAHVTLEKNLMWYWQYFKAASTGVDWHLYVLPANADGSKADPADRVTWDAYSPLEWHDRYATPAEFMQFALAVWNESAVPWGYGELGALPKTAPGDAAWVAATKSYADAARTPSLAGTVYAALPAAQTFKYWDAFNEDGVHTYELSQNLDAVSMYAAYVSSMPMVG